MLPIQEATLRKALILVKFERWSMITIQYRLIIKDR